MPSFLLTWIHLVAVATLIGGLVFLNLVVYPVLQNMRPASQRMDIMKEMGRRFRTLTWVSLVTLILTGAAQMLNESGSARIETMWGVVLMVKLLVFAISFGLLLIHDFILDPYGEPAKIPTPPLASAASPSGIRLLQQIALTLMLTILLIASYLTTM